MRRLFFRGRHVVTRRGGGTFDKLSAAVLSTSKGGGRSAVGLAAAVASLVAVVGCGGGGQTTGLVFIPEESSFDRFFFEKPKAEASTRDVFLAGEVERLMLPTWEIARRNLLDAGKEAVPRLIESLDRRDATQVAIRPISGRTVPDMSPTWNLGQVVHSILVDLIGGRTNFAGTQLPALDKVAWQKWWVDNGKALQVYTALTTVPEYVRKQQEEARKALAARYDRRGRIIEERKPGDRKKRAALDKQKAAAERKAKDDLTKKEKAQADAVKRSKKREAEREKREKREAETAGRKKRKTKKAPPPKKKPEEKPEEKVEEQPEEQPEEKPEE